MCSLFLQSQLTTCRQRPQFANRARSKSSSLDSRAQSQSSSSDSQRSRVRLNDDDERRIPHPTVSDGDSDDDLQPKMKSHYRTPAVQKKALKATKGVQSKRQEKQEQEVSVSFSI